MKRSSIFAIIVLLFAFALSGCNKANEVTNNSSARKTAEDFSHARIGVSIGSVQELLLDEMFPEAQKVLYESTADLGIALDSKKIDAIILDTGTGSSLTAAYNNITYVNKDYAPSPCAAIFAKNEKSDKLRKEYNEYINKLRDSGELEQLSKKWISPDYPTNDCPSLPTKNGNNKPIEIASNTCFEPFVFYKNNELSGFDIELMAGFCNEYNYYPIYNDMNFEVIITGIATEKYDMSSAFFSITEERAKMVNFSDPIFNVSNRIYYIDENATSLGLSSNITERIKATFITENRWKLLLNGVLSTIIITCLSAILGTIIGFLIAKLLLSKKKAPSVIARGFVRAFQGTPIVVVLMVFYYIIFGHSSIPNVLVASFAFACNFGAYSANIMCQGIKSVHPGQREAALALGFTESESFRRFVFPQAIEQFAPVFIGELISLLKSTSIVGYIAIQDLTKMGDIIRSRTYDAFVPLITIALIYYLLALLLNRSLTHLERRIIPEKKPRKPKGVDII